MLSSNLSPSEWILKVIRHYGEQAFEWAVQNARIDRLRHIAQSEYATPAHEAQLADLIMWFRGSRAEINAYFKNLHQERGEFTNESVISLFLSVTSVGSLASYSTRLMKSIFKR